MLGSFIRHGLTQEEASRESLLNVVAGSDTSATIMRLILMSLLINPVAYRKLQEEIDAGVKASKISSPVTDAEARQLPYLQAAIKEGLRIKAPAAGPLFKAVPPEGDIIDGKFIPGGTQIGTSPFGVYHSKEVFGEDASVFLPERWLEADKARSATMSSVVDLVFSSGKFQCLGEAVALMEINKTFVEVSICSRVASVFRRANATVQLMRRFDFVATRPERPLHITNAISGIFFKLHLLHGPNFALRVYGLSRTFRCGLHDVKLAFRAWQIFSHLTRS